MTYAKLFTPPMLDTRDKMIFALYDHESNHLFELYERGRLDYWKIDSMETVYIDRLEKMDDEKLRQEYADKIGSV